MPGMIKRLKVDDFFAYPDQIYSLYILGFAGPPYFEAFRIEELNKMANEFWFAAKDAIVLACFEAETERLQGFFIGYCVEAESEVCKLLSSKVDNFNPEDYFYMAEVVTHSEFRGRGIATTLVDSAIQYRHNKYSKFIVRTNSDNGPSLRLHKNLGFQTLKNVTEDVLHQRTGGDTNSDKRVFLSLEI